MTRPRALVGALLLMHAAVAAAQIHEGKTIVTARLVADTIRVQPGKPFTAGVHLTIAPGWHVYWENPGDTALPVAVDWRLPAGVTASPLQWPAPETYQEEGGVTVFGYENETLLLSQIVPARAGDSLTLRAKAEWLVCEKVCIPGEALLDLTLPPGDPAPSPEAGMIRRYAARVPVPGASAGVRIAQARARKEKDAWRIVLRVEVPGRKIVRFFPRTIDGFLIEHGGIAIEGNAVAFTALPDEPALVPKRISGVLVTSGGTFDVAADIAAGEEELPAPAPISTPTAEPGIVSPLPPSDVPSQSNVSSGDWLSAVATPSSATALSLPTLLLFAALGGLLLNVMPCVLPVISLKILSFVHQAGHDSRRTRFLGLVFGAGVVVSFWILLAAVAVVRASAEQIGWGFQFQSPVFVLAMSVVVLIFAMNLFGVFEIAGPSFSGAALRAQGPAGAFTHGVLATVLATPCTAPFLGTAIGFAFTQPFGTLFLAFTAAAIGLALPYVLLSWHPAWLRWLPKPGPWMIRFKQAMGFVLVGTVVWLLSVLGGQLGPDGVVWSLVFLTIVAFAVWMVGQWPAGSGTTRAVIRLVALALVVIGYVWALERELRWREPLDAPGLSEATSGGIQWEPFSLDDLRARVERGETVFIDFTADWCWSCKVNERTVLSTRAVEEHIRRLNVTAVKADWTRRNPEITRLLAKFGRAGVPFYVVFPAGRLHEPVALSEVITPRSVIAALDRAGPSLVERNE